MPESLYASLTGYIPVMGDATSEQLPSGGAAGAMSSRSPSLVSHSSRATTKDAQADEDSPMPSLLRRISNSIQFKRKGSHLPLPSADEIPANFLASCKGNVEKAGRKWQVSKQWREENDIDHILQRPHPHYETLKTVYPAFLHGRDLQGNCISVEIPGSMNVKLMKSAKLSPRDMALHLALVQEYVWTVLTPGDDRKIVTLMDAKGLSLTRLASPDSLALIRAASETLNNHYPDRVLRILVVNAPRFFGPIFRLLSTVMPASVRDQFQICSSPADVEKFISPDVLPVEYGGKNSLKFGQSEEEVSLRALVDRNNAEGGDRQMDK
ncbi:sec14 cytosolic [Nannochloropsis gaditana]|uniref:Sec14 cytosolic n=1 Tax=Nannochloropsis gaditana TaxID=72520 RepID=W7TCC3_9STRA|nr:sec14 cytosolic [Nannochloropsis gaditana]